ncbi:unnamed protein product [Hapterophycus canaliculatus]
MPYAHAIIQSRGSVLTQDKRSDNGCGLTCRMPVLPEANYARNSSKFMVHQKCGDFNPNAPCMTIHKQTNRNYCSKHYPQPLSDSYATDPNTGRVAYQRLDDDDTATIRRQNGEHRRVETDIDDGYIAPYN